MVVGGPDVVVVVVVVGGAVVVVVGGTVVVVVVVAGGGFLAVVVVAATVVVVTGREIAVLVVVAATGLGLSRVAADVGAVAVAVLVGVLWLASNVPANKELTEPAPNFAGVVAVLVCAGRDVAAVVGVVAAAVLGAAAFDAVGEVRPLSDGGVIFCTNPM